VCYPTQLRNYCIFDEANVSQKKDLGLIKTSLENSPSEDEVVEDLYILNLMLDEGNNDVTTLYPVLSKYNNTNNPNIQTFLAGIYRKTKIPDAFGPLCAMLIRNSINPPTNCHFDPNELLN
jgi:hypothetical protein